MKLSELMNKYGDIDVSDIPDEPKTVWDLKKEDKWYSMTGILRATQWGGQESLDFLRSIGLVSLTPEESQFKCEQMKVETELERLGGTKNMTSLSSPLKYYIEYGTESGTLHVGSNITLQWQGTYFFTSIEACERAIETIGKERLLKYLFYVSED